MRGYSIVDLLIDQYYSPTSMRRRGLGGIINYATKREDTYPASGWQDYAIRYRPTNSFQDNWATVTVRMED